MNHASVIIFVGIGIAIIAIGLNVFSWNDEVVSTPESVSSSRTNPKTGVAGLPSSSAKEKDLANNSVSTTRDITSKRTKQTAIAPTFDVVRVTPKGYAVIAGRSQPNSTIVIFDNGQTLGEIKADEHGEWVFVPEKPLEPGNRQLSLEQHSQGWESPIKSSKVVMIVIPERNKTIAGKLNEEPSQALALKFPRDSDGPSTILQKPRADDSGLKLSVDTVDYDNDGRLYLSGKGGLQRIIQVYLDDSLLGRASVNANGGWTLKPNQPVSPGIYRLRADEINKLGKVLARIELPFARAEASNTLPPEPMVVVQPGNSLWRLARRVYGKGFRFTTIYAANKSQIKNPDLIYPGQVFAIPKIN